MLNVSIATDHAACHNCADHAACVHATDHAAYDDFYEHMASVLKSIWS
jgi:hypothetical protein